MLMDLGPNVYQEDFERAFLKETAEFYQVRLAAICHDRVVLLRYSLSAESHNLTSCMQLPRTSALSCFFMSCK